MTCKQMKVDLALAALGALSEAELAEVRQHAAACQQCAVRMREYEAVCAAQKIAAEELKTVYVPRNCTVRPGHRPYSTRQLGRWLLPAAGIGAMAAILVLALRPPGPTVAPKEPTSVIAVTEDAQPSAPNTIAVATLAGYRQALVRQGAASLEELLERDADVLLPSASLKELQSLTQAQF